MYMQKTHFNYTYLASPRLKIRNL